MLHRLLHKCPTKNSKIPISPLHAQKSCGSRLGSLSFSLGICAAVFGAFAFFIFFFFVLQLFSIGNFKGSHAITTFVAIFPLAATSGPLISASNSMQYPASLSSGTPCSTSQSSGTLVVPSFISTYGYVYGVAAQKRYIGQVHRFGALCTAVH